MWIRVYCFEVHQILAEYDASSKISIMFWFPANSPYNLHPIKLKLDLQLDHDVEQSTKY